MSKPKISITNWKIVFLKGNGINGTDVAIQGTALSHPGAKNDCVVETSPLIKLDGQMFLAETNNTIYKLEQIDPEFEEWLNQKRTTLLDLSFEQK